MIDDEVISHLDSLSGAVKELASAQLLAAAEQRAYVTAEAHAMKRRTKLERFVLAGLIAVFVGLVANGLGLWAVYDSSHTNHQVLTTVKDCTDPSGECAQRGQQATAQAVMQINRAATVAAFCAAHSETLAATEACVAAHP